MFQDVRQQHLMSDGPGVRGGPVGATGKLAATGLTIPVSSVNC